MPEMSAGRSMIVRVFCLSHNEAEMTPEILASVAGVILSLAFSYIPNLRTWFAEKPKEQQQLSMLALMFVVAAASYGLACAGILTELFGVALTCDRSGLLGLIQALIFAIMANQGVYQLTPRAADVRLAKAERDGAADLGLGRG
jgi:putative flippase GtrA